jgi:predicted GNAT family acetyltransferase
MFEKMKSDIWDAYIEANNINIKKKFNSSEITHDMNAILFKCLTSYYFENKFDVKFVKVEAEKKDYYFIIAAPTKNDEDLIKYKVQDEKEKNRILEYYSNNEKNKISNFRKISIIKNLENNMVLLNYEELTDLFKVIPTDLYQKDEDIFKYMYDGYFEGNRKGFPDYYPYDNKKQEVDIVINEKIQRAINLLIEKPEFNILLENDPIKKVLNLKNKHNFEFKTINIDYSKQELCNYLKFENYSYINNAMKNIYGMKYESQSKNEDYKLIIAHNDFEIAGNLAIADGSKYHKFKSGMCAYVSHIEVADSFYGNGLGVKLMEKAIQYAEENKLILMRTSPSELGKQYIKDKITDIGIKKDIALVSSNESNIISKLLMKIQDQSQDQILETVKKTLTYIRKNLNEKDLEYGIQDNDIIKMFAKSSNTSSNKLKL